MFIFYFYMYFQVSLGLKQLQFLMAILVLGILMSLILCSIEKAITILNLSFLALKSYFLKKLSDMCLSPTSHGISDGQNLSFK